MVIKNIAIPIYGGRLHIIISGDLEKDLGELSKKFNRTIFGEKFSYVGFCTCIENHYVVVLNIKNVPKRDYEAEVVNTIAHETVHLYNFISKSPCNVS